jgi:TonB family protein
MKASLLIALVFLCAGATYASAQDTLYYDIRWKLTTADHAAYFRLRTRKGDGWQFSDHWLSGKTEMTGAFSDGSMQVKEGEYIWYDSTGNVNHRCIYVHGKQNGPETYYFGNGQIWMTGENQDDQSEGLWTGYYPSGKVAAEATYKQGKQVSAKFYHEDSTLNESIKEFIREAEFPGGSAEWSRFLRINLHYPDSAAAHKVEGTVVIGFVVSKDGTPGNFQVFQSVNKYLDAEAVRVIRLMPRWTPAIYGGTPADSYKLQPVVFKIPAN